MSDDTQAEQEYEALASWANQTIARLTAERDAARDLAFRAAFAPILSHYDEEAGRVDDDALYDSPSLYDEALVQTRFDERPSLDTLLGFVPEGTGE